MRSVFWQMRVPSTVRGSRPRHVALLCALPAIAGRQRFLVLCMPLESLETDIDHYLIGLVTPSLGTTRFARLQTASSTLCVVVDALRCQWEG